MQEKKYTFIISGEIFTLSNLDIWIGHDIRYDVCGTRKAKRYVEAIAPYKVRKYLNTLFDEISEWTEHSERVFFDYLDHHNQ